MNHQLSKGEAFGLAAVTALSLGLNTTAAPETAPVDPAVAARLAIASRYASCGITKVTHDAAHPVRSTDGDRELRNKVSIQLQLTDTPEATAALKRYDEDDTVYWQRPEVIATLVNGEGEANPRSVGFKPAKAFGASYRTEDLRPTADFMPRIYPNDTEAAVFTANTAETSDDKGFTRTTGYQFCGSLVVKNGVWTAENGPIAPLSLDLNPFIGPDSQPVHPQPNVTVETVIPYGDNTQSTSKTTAGN
jgi:hypothetical protein